MIGELNGKLPISVACTKKGTAISLPLTGDLLRNERVCIDWKLVNTGGVWLHLAWKPSCLVAAVCLQLGEEAEPTAVRVWDAKHTRCMGQYVAETGKMIAEKRLVIPVNAETDALLIEIDSDLADLDLCGLILYGAVEEAISLYPSPSKVAYAEGVCALDALKTVAGQSEREKRAAQILIEKLGECGREVQFCEENGDIAFVTDETVAENGYRLQIAPSAVTIAASDLRGMVMGAETLVKLAAAETIPCAIIDDAPAHAFRGVHLYLPSVEEMAFAKRLVKYLLSPMGYNAVILEIAGAMAFDSHPEINEAVQHALAKARAGEWPSLPHGGVAGGTVVPKAEVRAFCDYVRSFGIDVIPEIQSLAHVQYLTVAYPEIGERAADAEVIACDDARAADIPPDAFYAHSFCPSNPRSYEILFDIADEIIETVAPTRYVHMGHDEVYQIGICPICSKRDPADLLAEDLCKLHAYLAQKGLKMMIWADMLQANSPYKTVAALEKIPKDIFLLDFIWYFHPERDIEDALLPSGLPVAFGNLYSSHFPRYASRAAKNGIFGGQISMWVPTALYPLARDGKLYDLVYTAEMLWSPYAEEARNAYDAAISARIPRLREQLEAKTYPSLEKNAQRDTIWQADAPSVLPDGTICAPETCTKSVIFVHAAQNELRRVPWSKPTQLGAYTVHYADGETLSVPIAYGTTVGYIGRRKNAPMAGMYHRHTGYQGTTWYLDEALCGGENGQTASWGSYEWINPRPQVPISVISFAASPNAETAVLGKKIEIIF